MAKGLQAISRMHSRRAARERRAARITESATYKDIANNQFLSDEEKAQFQQELLASNQLSEVTDIPRANLFGDLRGGDPQIGKSDIGQRITDMTQDRRRRANLEDLRNRLTQVSGFAGIQQRRTAMTKQLSPGQDNASRKGTTLITSRT